MEYTINQVSKIAGITTRTLRYYDKIGLLSPSRISSSNYRIYDSKTLDVLQNILIYKELDLDLKTIAKLLNNKDFNHIKTLKNSYIKMKSKKDKIERSIALIKKTIDYHERNIKMDDKEKFEELKDQIIKSNDEKYGKELTEKYGKATIDQSYEKVRKMSKFQMNEANRIGEEINIELKKAVLLKDPSSKQAQHVCELHQRWIKMYWPVYTVDAHMALCEMYLEDERFKSYYEKIQEGATEFLNEAMKIYLGK